MNKEYELDMARTLVSAAPRLVSALLGGTCFSLSRRAELAPCFGLFAEQR
jgi:hypothetical protein